MVLAKILPYLPVDMEQVDTTAIREVAAKLFCPGIKLHYYFEQKMRSIGRNIAKIWKADNIGELVGSITEIGVELTETMDKLAKMVKETEDNYIKEMESLYAVTTMIGPQVKETLKAAGRIETEATKIRWALKSLGETTVRRCKKIIACKAELLQTHHGTKILHILLHDD